MLIHLFFKGCACFSSHACIEKTLVWLNALKWGAKLWIFSWIYCETWDETKVDWHQRSRTSWSCHFKKMQRWVSGYHGDIMTVSQRSRFLREALTASSHLTPADPQDWNIFRLSQAEKCKCVSSQFHHNTSFWHLWAWETILSSSENACSTHSAPRGF